MHVPLTITTQKKQKKKKRIKMFFFPNLNMAITLTPDIKSWQNLLCQKISELENRLIC